MPGESGHHQRRRDPRHTPPVLLHPFTDRLNGPVVNPSIRHPTIVPDSRQPPISARMKQPFGPPDWYRRRLRVSSFPEYWESKYGLKLTEKEPVRITVIPERTTGDWDVTLTPK
jgi:hypothetical protein